MELNEALDGAASPDVADADAAEEEGAGRRSPMVGEGAEGVAEPCEGVVAPSSELGFESALVAVDAGVYVVVSELSVAVAPTLGGDGSDDGGEVAFAVADVVAMDLRGEALLGFEERVGRVATEGVDEGASGSGKRVGLVDAREDEARGALVSARVLTLLGGGASEVVGGDGAAGVERTAGGACAGLVGPQERGDEDVDGSAGELGVGERRDARSEASAATQDGSSRGHIVCRGAAR